jgi:hypothetical protein
MALAALFSLVPYLPCLPAQPRTGKKTPKYYFAAIAGVGQEHRHGFICKTRLIE